MKLSESFEYKGYWWLPSSPDDQVAGVLKYEPRERIVLELFGMFGEDNESFVSTFNQKEEAVIHGKLENGKDVTLLKCHPAVSLNFSSFPITRYTCIYCFVGRHYMGMDEVGMFQLTVHFPEMPYWCHPGVLQETFFQSEDNEKQAIQLSFETVLGGKLIHEVVLEDGYKLQLKSSANFKSELGLLDNVIGQTTWIEFSSEKKTSFTKLLSHAYKFEEFFSLTTLRVVEMSELTFYDENYYQEYGNGQKIHHPVSLISSHWRGKDTEKVNRDKFLFSYDAIKDKFTDLVKAWYSDKSDMYPIRSCLVDSLEKKRVFSNMDFFILARALDGYCIRLKIKGSISNRMKAVIDRFSDVSRITKDNINIEELVDSRDYYAHYMPRSSKEHILDGFDLLDLTNKIRRLLICCVLSDLGLTNTDIDVILRKSNSSFTTGH